jgi:hypothetical protein
MYFQEILKEKKERNIFQTIFSRKTISFTLAKGIVGTFLE